MIQMNMDKNTWFQSLQLLHDIRFELLYLNKHHPCKVLQNYYQLSDNGRNLSPLLATKLSTISFQPQPWKPLNNQKLQTSIDKILKSTKHMPKKEAELIQQAAFSIHSLALQKERDPSFKLPENVPTFLEDARYEPLRAHKGLAKIW